MRGRLRGRRQRHAELCRERRVELVDVAAELRRSDVWRAQIAADDGAHPGAEGYELIARRVLACGWLDWLAG